MFDAVRKRIAEVHFKINWSKKKKYSDKHSVASNHFVGLKIKNGERMSVMKTEEKNPSGFRRENIWRKDKS